MDNQNSWLMLPDGSYRREANEHLEPLDSHLSLHEYFEKPLEISDSGSSLFEKLRGLFHKKGGKTI